MKDIFWIKGKPGTRLAIVLRPRGESSLDSEMQRIRRGGVETLVSLLEPEEAEFLGLAEEPAAAARAGLRFLSYPIPDIHVPLNPAGFSEFAAGLAGRLLNGESVGVHCRGCIGRSTVTAACALIHLGWKPQDALTAIKAARGCPVPDTMEQRNWILGYKPPAGGPSSGIDFTFPHHWQAEILALPPLILPPRHFVYPRQAEEVERGALEVLVRRPGAQPFLATCALGFSDPAVPTGIWSSPNPDEVCAIAGGYAYLIDTTAPERFTMLPYRPVLELRAAPAEGLLLFVGHRSILAWGRNGQAWESERLSDEGVTVSSIEDGILRGTGWQMKTDRETLFALDLRTGALQSPSS